MKNTIVIILRWGTLLSTYGLIASVVLQIYARFFLANTPPWTEETSRLFFIYATAFASGLALQENYYVYLDLFFDRLSKKYQDFLRLAIPFLIALLFGLFTFASIGFITRGHHEFSPSMKIRMSFVFISMLVLGASLTYFALVEFVNQYNKRNS